MNHVLKIDKAFFEAAACGDKTFEIRNNRDRGFQKGDTIRLNEASHISPALTTGRSLTGVITYVLNYEQKPDFVVFSFKLDEVK
jgi:ASC-1-like (ASCH) protein